MGNYLLLGILVYFIVFLFYSKKKNTSKNKNDVENTQEAECKPNWEITKNFHNLKTNILEIHIGKNLVDIVEENGFLLGAISGLRKRMSLQTGFIFDKVMVMDTSKIEKNEYVIFVREKEVARGVVEPNKYLFFENDLKIYNIEVPNDWKKIYSHIYNTNIYWADYFPSKVLSQIDFKLAENVIIDHFELVIKSHIDEIFTIKDAYQYWSYIKKYYSSELATDIDLSYAEIKTILLELLRNNVSIRNISYIFEKMFEYYQQTHNVKFIAQKISSDIKTK